MNTQSYRAWLGSEASIWAHRGYEVHGESVYCESKSDAKRVVGATFGQDLVYVRTDDGVYYYRDAEDMEADQTGACAIAVVAPLEDFE